MKRITSVFLFALCLVAPRVCVAQKLGQVECGQGDGSVYLYSSMLTLNIQTTLKCGQQIQILGRYDNFLQVRTDKGEIGFAPVDAVRYVKSTAAARSTMGRQKDKRAAAASRNEKAAVASPSQARVAAPEIILPNQTPVHLQFGRAVSSADARVGEEVSFEVTQ